MKYLHQYCMHVSFHLQRIHQKVQLVKQILLIKLHECIFLENELLQVILTKLNINMNLSK